MVELNDGFQLVGCVVGVLHGVLRLIGDAGQIAGAVVGVDDGGPVGVEGLGEALAGVELELRGMAVGVGLRDAIAGVIITISEVALDAGEGDEAAGGVVGVAGGVPRASVSLILRPALS
jgi:hypothetical protein